MNSIRNRFALLCLMLVAGVAQAASLPLQNISDEDFKKVTGDLSANFLHTSVSGASTLGHLWGFEVGVDGASTSSPHLNDVVHKADPNADAGKVYNAEAFAAVSVPFGITGEIGLLPKVGSSGFKFSDFSLAAKWTITELFLSDLPFSLAVKGIYTQAKVDVDTTVNNVPVSYNYTGKSTAGWALISKNLMILEPYAGIGLVNGKGDMSASTTNVFASGATSGSATKSGMGWMVGTEVKLLVVKLGVEYANLLDTSKIGGKLSFYF